MAAEAGGRRAEIGDAAITVLAGQGMRGLTHRAVDREAGLPTGSTSYYARTRAGLLELVMGRMVELDTGRTAEAGLAMPAGPDALADILAELAVDAATRDRVRSLARFEFALEATRRPELRRLYDAAGATVRAPAESLLAAMGSAEPARHARAMVVWLDGMVFDWIAGAGGQRPPTRDDLRASARELLAGMLGG